MDDGRWTTDDGRRDELTTSNQQPATSNHSVLWLGEHARSRHQLSLQFGLDDLRFTASYWYAGVDLYSLESKYGRDFMERIYFHIAAFTANTLVSLRPTTFDPGPYARYCTSDFWTLWKAVIRGAWAQWRYEHDQPDTSTLTGRQTRVRLRLIDGRWTSRPRISKLKTQNS